MAGLEARFIELAGQINGAMPEYVVGKIVRALNGAKRAINGSRILLLGVAYKANIDDLRESPALDILRLVREQGGEVVYHDPHVAQFASEGVEYRSVPLSAEELRRCDLAVITVAHRGIDFELVRREAPLIVDTRNALGATGDPRITRI
jgi:UDP-N-acetyl-D-mannosaminuronate dehydrogenase